MSIPTIFEAPDSFKANSLLPSRAAYDALYAESVADPEAFWRSQANRIHWFKPFDRVKNTLFSKDTVDIRWYEGGQTNACYNAVDRHAETQPEKTALIFVPDDPANPPIHISYQTLLQEVSRFANVLKHLGVSRGDRVTIYLPMIPEAAYAMLACARIGAIHSVVFAGFSPESLSDRINDCDSHLVITADEGRRGGKTVPLKKNADAAAERCTGPLTILTVRNTGASVHMEPDRDIWYHEVYEKVSDVCEATPMDAEDPLFILYTSGSTGKPKGVLHTTGGYQVYASLTHEYVFDVRADEVFWCTADVGWITGHSYIVYGPLINGVTQVFFEGVPTWPDAGRFWDVVDLLGVTSFYTAPTAIRALMAQGDAFVTRAQRSSLRLLGTVGEPINPEAWRWYHEVVGDGRCPIVDTWWQTETGGIMISPLPGAVGQKPGSATLPMFGIQPALLTPEGTEIDGAGEGILVVKDSWPGQARSVYRNHQRFIDTYFTAYPGMYFTGDGCRRDEDGYYWITGRVDDVINVSGHRMGTAEVESALVGHAAVAEAAVVGFPHDIKGQGIYCYVTLNHGVASTDALKQELVQEVRTVIGPIATPDFIQFAPGLPKTRSGKIMRRILRKLAANDPDNLGDTSTLADPSVVEDLRDNRLNRD